MRKQLIPFGIALCMLSTSTVGHAQSWSIDKLEAALPTVQTVVDITGWFGKKPEPAREFVYSETRRFDMKLHQSLKAKFETINIKTEGKFLSTALPVRMDRWLAAIEKKGKVRTCLVDSDSKGLFSFLALIFKAASAVDKWLLYKPAKNFDALVIVTPEDNKVINVVFTAIGTVNGCPTGTTEKSAAAK